MDLADDIWNRALSIDFVPIAPGDRALVDLLRLHSLGMNGGILNAVEQLGDEEVEAAVDGYRWMGLAAAADEVERVHGEIEDGALDDDARAERLELDADAAYFRAIPDDASLERAFRARLAGEPAAFAST